MQHYEPWQQTGSAQGLPLIQGIGSNGCQNLCEPWVELLVGGKVQSFHSGAEAGDLCAFQASLVSMESSVANQGHIVRYPIQTAHTLTLQATAVILYKPGGPCPVLGAVSHPRCPRELPPGLFLKPQPPLWT